MNRRGFIGTLAAGAAALFGRKDARGTIPPVIEPYKPIDATTNAAWPSDWLPQQFLEGTLSANDVRRLNNLAPLDDDVIAVNYIGDKHETDAINLKREELELDSFRTHGLYPIEPRIDEDYLEESRIRASVNLPPLPYLVAVRPASLRIYSDGSQEIKILDDYRRGCGFSSCIKEIGT